MNEEENTKMDKIVEKLEHIENKIKKMNVKDVKFDNFNKYIIDLKNELMNMVEKYEENIDLFENKIEKFNDEVEKIQKTFNLDFEVDVKNVIRPNLEMVELNTENLKCLNLEDKFDKEFDFNIESDFEYVANIVNDDRVNGIYQKYKNEFNCYKIKNKLKICININYVPLLYTCIYNITEFIKKNDNIKIPIFVNEVKEMFKDHGRNITCHRNKYMYINCTTGNLIHIQDKSKHVFDRWNNTFKINDLYLNLNHVFDIMLNDISNDDVDCIIDISNYLKSNKFDMRKLIYVICIYCNLYNNEILHEFIYFNYSSYKVHRNLLCNKKESTYPKDIEKFLYDVSLILNGSTC